MTKNKAFFLTTVPVVIFLIHAVPSFAQDTLLAGFTRYAKGISGHVGVCVQMVETGEAVDYQGDKRFPMQSVYKFPIAMAVLSRVDKGEFAIDQKIKVDTSDYIPRIGHSPLRDQFPHGGYFTINSLLRYDIIESDGAACDVLLRILGGTKVADRYVHDLGVQDIAISTTEKIQVAQDTIQYQNWATPKGMVKLLHIFYDGQVLSEKSRALLLKLMIDSRPGAKRLKGRLPKGTIVAHKTGTSGTFGGLTRSTNDVGIITLPSGKHLAIAVFVSDSRASEKARELIIANISSAAFDWARVK
jgi:beta-lactamase class A